MDQAQPLRNIIKLKNQRIVEKARVITITSGKGGVGKSSTSVNLAVCLQRMGKKVIIFDADFGLANVEVMFGAYPKYSLKDVIFGDKRVTDIITEGPEGIGFISGGSGIAGLNNLNHEQIAYLVNQLSQLDNMADVIIIDTGAGISDTVLEFVMASPEIIVVSTPDPSSLTDSYSLMKALYTNPGFRKESSVIKVLANKVNSDEDARIVYDKLNTVVQRFLNGSLEYLGMIPYDAVIDKAIRQQKPVTLCFPTAKASKYYELAADNLIHNNQKTISMKTGIAHLFSEFLSKRR